MIRARQTLPARRKLVRAGLIAAVVAGTITAVGATGKRTTTMLRPRPPKGTGRRSSAAPTPSRSPRHANEKKWKLDEYGVPVLDFDSVVEARVEVGLGPLHTQFDDKGYAYTSLFLDSAVCRWTLGGQYSSLHPEAAWQELTKIPVQYNVGHICIPGGDTAHPDGKYLVSLSKWSGAFGPLGMIGHSRRTPSRGFRIAFATSTSIGASAAVSFVRGSLRNVARWYFPLGGRRGARPFRRSRFLARDGGQGGAIGVVRFLWGAAAPIRCWRRR